LDYYEAFLRPGTGEFKYAGYGLYIAADPFTGLYPEKFGNILKMVKIEKGTPFISCKDFRELWEKHRSRFQANEVNSVSGKAPINAVICDFNSAYQKDRDWYVLKYNAKTHGGSRQYFSIYDPSPDSFDKKAIAKVFTHFMNKINRIFKDRSSEYSKRYEESREHADEVSKYLQGNLSCFSDKECKDKIKSIYDNSIGELEVHNLMEYKKFFGCFFQEADKSLFIKEKLKSYINALEKYASDLTSSENVRPKFCFPEYMSLLKEILNVPCKELIVDEDIDNLTTLCKGE
jgi:hypothetical protein